MDPGLSVTHADYKQGWWRSEEWTHGLYVDYIWLGDRQSLLREG